MATKNLDDFRLDGTTISAGCMSCPLRPTCGGLTRIGGAWSCMDGCDRCDKSTCSRVCLKRPEAFAHDVFEVNGFEHRDIPALHQPKEAVRLPRYIPVVGHASSRDEPATTPWAAIPLRRLFRMRNNVYQPVAEDAAGLRRTFGLSSHTRLLLLGTGQDKFIERYWRFAGRDEVVSKLSALDFRWGITPNFSFVLDHPRPEHLYNRKRTLLCARDWSAQRLPTVPTLLALTTADWHYWLTFLREHPEIRVVGKEFQTGLAHPHRGLYHLDQLARLQDELRRPMHLVAIGGAQYRHELQKRFETWTVIDSTPFMKALHRQAAERGPRRVRWRRAKGEPVDRLLDHNICTWSDWLGQTVARRQ